VFEQSGLALIQRNATRIPRAVRFCFALSILTTLLLFPAWSSAQAIPSTMFSTTLVNRTTPWPLIPLGAEGKPALTKWVYDEQVKGVFNWTTLDSFVAGANSHGVPIMWTHEAAPPWAVGGQTNCTSSSNYSLPQCNCNIAGDGISIQCYGAVTDLAGLRDFIVALVTRYDGNHGHGAIAAYELYNEPDASFTGGMANLVAQANTMHDAIRGANASVLILGMGLDVPNTHFAPGDYMDQFWAGSGTKDLDVISFHGYPHQPPLDNSPETINDYVTTIKACMARNGVSAAIWDTEGSYGNAAYGVTDSNSQVGWLARSFLLHWSNGVTRYNWYSYDDNQWGTLLSASGQLNAAGVAYGKVHDWMVGATMSSCSIVSGSVWACVLTRSNNAVAQVVWDTSGSSTYTASAKFIQYEDLAGNTSRVVGGVPIGIRPIMLEGPSAPTNLTSVVH